MEARQAAARLHRIPAPPTRNPRRATSEVHRAFLWHNPTSERCSGFPQATPPGCTPGSHLDGSVTWPSVSTLPGAGIAEKRPMPIRTRSRLAPPAGTTSLLRAPIFTRSSSQPGG